MTAADLVTLQHEALVRHVQAALGVRSVVTVLATAR